MTVACARGFPCMTSTTGVWSTRRQFPELRDAGDPVELAAEYDAQGADEPDFSDVTASSSGRGTMHRGSCRRTAEGLPFRQPSARRCPLGRHVDVLLRARGQGLVNTAAISSRVAPRVNRTGSAVSAFRALRRCRAPLLVDGRTQEKPTPSGWESPTHGGRRGPAIDAIEYGHAAVRSLGWANPAQPHGRRTVRSGFRPADDRGGAGRVHIRMYLPKVSVVAMEAKYVPGLYRRSRWMPVDLDEEPEHRPREGGCAGKGLAEGWTRLAAACVGEACKTPSSSSSAMIMRPAEESRFDADESGSGLLFAAAGHVPSESGVRQADQQQGAGAGSGEQGEAQELPENERRIVREIGYADEHGPASFRRAIRREAAPPLRDAHASGPEESAASNTRTVARARPNQANRA
ncbi:hypothetical protein FQA39_LY18963 [Lamprigera yunnana]|nr:hypothetical protein FQA39_LY18963 [Lamprigera yunnana]